MSERYAKLFALPENLYAMGAPVVIAAGALLKDNQTGKVLAQLKIQNIQDKAIKAATVKITPLDTVGKPLGGEVEYQYLDLNAARDTDFGQKAPVALPDAATRAFSVSVAEVIFTDNTAWTASGAPWEPLAAPVPLEQALKDRELAKQYKIKYGENCQYIFKTEKDLWRCACGAINRQGERLCHKCQKEAVLLAALNLDELEASKTERLKIEQQKAAEAKAAAETKAKKTKKIAMIAAPIIVVAIVAAVLISNFVKAQQEEAARLEAYNAAAALAEAGQYDEAIAAFTELGDYKDSPEQILQAKYTKALELVDMVLYDYETAIDIGAYETAIKIFAELGDYKDSAEQIQNTEYIQANQLLQDGKYADAASLFTELGDYKDSADIAAELSVYQDAVQAYLNGDIEPFLAALKTTPQYVTFSEKQTAIWGCSGTWEYLSGDARAVTMGGDITNYEECHSIDIEYDNSSMLVYIRPQYRLRYTINEEELRLEYGHAQIKRTSDDTLLVTVEKKGETVAVCEYQRVEG